MTKKIIKYSGASKKTKKTAKKKTHPPELEENIDKTGLSDKPQILDLLVPAGYHEAIVSNGIPNEKLENYLPDLFIDKIQTKNIRIQVNGRFIAREEEQVEKIEKGDGIGIGIKFTP